MPQTIADKLQEIYDGVEDIRDALQEKDDTLGSGTIDTLGDDVRTLLPGTGYGVQVHGDVRTEEEVDGETVYTYTDSVILDSTLSASGDYINTDVIDGLGELDGDMVTLANGKVQIPLNTGTVLIVDPTKTYVKFRDPIVENIILTNWGTNGKITLAQVRAITTFGTNFNNTAIETFDEFKWFDGMNITSPTGASATVSLFSECTSLKSIKLPRVTDLGDKVFYHCTSLTSVIIPPTLTCLGKGYTYQKGYFDDTAIEELVIPSSITLGTTDVFRGMASLKKLVWGDNLPFPPTNYTGSNNILVNCSNLEKIENLPQTINPNNGVLGSIFAGCTKLDFTSICPLLYQFSTIGNGSRPFENSKIFDYSNSIATFPNITTNMIGTIDGTWNYAFNSSSEDGVVLNFPNWTNKPFVNYAGRVGKVVFSENVTTMGRFGQGSYVREYILPCTTPPELTYAGDPTAASYTRIFVPAASLETYKTTGNWVNVAHKLRAYKDPSTAAATFCSIPDAAPVPTDYTKVHYISNIDGTGIKNCQISNLGYQVKRYSQILIDFSHYRLPSASRQDYAALLYTSGNPKDFCLTVSGYQDYESPYIYRATSTNTNYPNPMGLTLDQSWIYNSRITGEPFGQRSILKFNYHWTEYHGLAHQVDEVTGDSTTNLMLLRYGNNNNQNRQYKFYRMCFFEPITGFTDVDDPSQYEIVRDYIPVMRNSDNKYGFYERLTDTFYPSTIAAAQFSGPTYDV